jgi:hypothetical protein
MSPRRKRGGAASVPWVHTAPFKPPSLDAPTCVLSSQTAPRASVSRIGQLRDGWGGKMRRGKTSTIFLLTAGEKGGWGGACWEISGDSF